MSQPLALLWRFSETSFPYQQCMMPATPHDSLMPMRHPMFPGHSRPTMRRNSHILRNFIIPSAADHSATKRSSPLHRYRDITKGTPRLGACRNQSHAGYTIHDDAAVSALSVGVIFLGKQSCAKDRMANVYASWDRSQATLHQSTPSSSLAPLLRVAKPAEHLQIFVIPALLASGGLNLNVIQGRRIQ